MASESANGSDPAKANGPGPTDSDPTEGDGLTPYERFERLTREIVSVPKAEINKRREKAKRPRTDARKQLR